MTWAQRLRRVFGIYIETYSACGGAVRIITCIEDAEVIEKILTYLDAKVAEPKASMRAHAGLMPFAGKRDGRARVPMATIRQFSWRKRPFLLPLYSFLRYLDCHRLDPP
ncbi:MAG: hypothetical protein WBM71_12070 [Sedimenticolaceae bacterium]